VVTLATHCEFVLDIFGIERSQQFNLEQIAQVEHEVACQAFLDQLFSFFHQKQVA
jgi:hypothetical protein